MLILNSSKMKRSRTFSSYADTKDRYKCPGSAENFGLSALGDSRYTSCNKKSQSNGNEETLRALDIVCSVAENRAREVCLCVMNSQNRAILDVYLVNDHHGYAETLDLLEELQPSEILLNNRTEGLLSMKIKEQYSGERHCANASIMMMSRQYFDQDGGAEMLGRVLLVPLNSEHMSHYTLLAGAFCLLRYLENCSGANFPSGSVRLDYHASDDKAPSLLIDRHTASALELVASARTGSLSASLFGVINRTKTLCGARLLRASLLRPSAHKSTIECRLNALEKLLSHRQRSIEIRTLLGKFPNIDSALYGLTSTPKTLTDKTVRMGIDALIAMKDALALSRFIADHLRLTRESDTEDIAAEESSMALLDAIALALANPSLDFISSLITDALNTSTTYA